MKVALQVLPSSDLVSPVTVPPTTVRSASSKSCTGSLKVKVTTLLSFALRSVATISTTTLGPWVSTAALSRSPLPWLPATSV